MSSSKISSGTAVAAMTASPKILVVDDDPVLLETLELVFARNGFEVATALDVTTALRLIGTEQFDVLLSDLHMPEPGDGLTVVSAMRHANAKTINLIFSGYPDMDQAAAAILQQADGVLLKPLGVEALVQSVRERLTGGAFSRPAVEDLATILERESGATIQAWLKRVDVEPHIITVSLDDAARSAYLPKLFGDLVSRLRHPLPLGTRALVSTSAAEHGLLRRKQGYTAAMMVEESRMLQVSIFQTLQDNLSNVDFSQLLVGVMAIADEVDSQLAQQMTSYIAASMTDQMSVVA